MERLSNRYEKKLVDQHLVRYGEPVFGELDVDITWNRNHPRIPILSEIASRLNINTLLFSKPAEPYWSIINCLLRKDMDTIFPKDNETRLFLHDIPVVRSFSASRITHRLKHRKCVIIKDQGVITSGTVSPEQTFINFSSVLFSCFVKFFVDFADDAVNGRLKDERIRSFNRVFSLLRPFPELTASLKKGPFESEESVTEAMSAAGKPVVEFGLVDSVMGNISYRYCDTLYISQTGSFLDELEGCIDGCPLDHSSCTGITASSELPTHMRIVKTTPYRAILHGHPKFAVIMSMICDKRDRCRFAGRCHISCPEPRFIEDIPIVPGESGTGKNAIVNTVPAALAGHRAVIVYGHGVFTADEHDFNAPFSMLYHIERMCRKNYINRLKSAGIL